MDTIYIGSDHGGFELKSKLRETLKKVGHPVVDVGPLSYDKADDYPDYSSKLCKQVIASHGKGILICRNGHGMAISANKFPGIYATICWNEESAREAKMDENVNVLVIPADFTTEQDAEKIIEAWIKSEGLNHERHQRRMNKIKEIEKENFKPF